MVVRREEGTARIHLSEISMVILETMQVYLSAYLLAECAKQKIPIVVSDVEHNPVGQYLPIYGSHNASKRLREQTAWGEPVKKRLWRRIVQDKISQQAEVLSVGGLKKDAAILKNYSKEVKSKDSTNREAAAAYLYFQSLFGEGFSRSTDNDINASLNYGYAILLSRINREIVSRGYSTQLGIFHRNEYNPFNLSCDFMEPFRPIFDYEVAANLEHGFDADMRKVLVNIMNQKLYYRDGEYRVGSVITQYVQDCLNALAKKIEVSQIEKFSIFER